MTVGREEEIASSLLDGVLAKGRCLLDRDGRWCGSRHGEILVVVGFTTWIPSVWKNRTALKLVTIYGSLRRKSCKRRFVVEHLILAFFCGFIVILITDLTYKQKMHD